MGLGSWGTPFRNGMSQTAAMAKFLTQPAVTSAYELISAVTSPPPPGPAVVLMVLGPGRSKPQPTASQESLHLQPLGVARLVPGRRRRKHSWAVW